MAIISSNKPVLEKITNVAYEYYVKGETWLPWLSAAGIVSTTLVRPLARNSLVRTFTVRVAAARADGTTLDNSGQVRLQSDTGGSKIIVVDFGMLRTVSGVGRVSATGPSMTICSLRAFRGDAFDTTSLYAEDCSGDVDGAMVRSADDNTFEIRTEKVRLTVKSSASLSALSAAIYLQFPDLPSDLDIRINGGAAVWSAPGVAQPNTHGWDANTQQTVDLTAALASITGDPHDATPFDANIVLGTRIPGLLTLDEVAVDIAYLARIAFGDTEDTTLALDQEGQYDVVLPLPSWATTVQEVRFTLTSTVPAERILEPVGPPRALQTGGSGAAYDLLLDVDHAGAARLDSAAPFSELTGVRLPLRAGVDGAEVRVVLYSGTSDGPTAPVDGGTSKPVDLSSNPDPTSDVWTTFAMPSSVKLDSTLTYWAVVVVGRGTTSWSLGSFTSAATTIPIRRGAANGPWHTLPSVIGDGSNLGARIRVIGRAPATAPVAPIVASVAGHENSQMSVTPSAKGVSAVWTPAGAIVGTTHPSIAPDSSGSSRSITLRLTSRMTGTLKISNVDIVATK